jgi:CDP-glucose 4,6-dehydratase
VAVVHDPAFWAGRRVLLTGHTGFKGSWLALWLHQMGAVVTGLSLPAEEISLFRQAGVERLLTHIEGDIRDMAVVEAAVAQADPEVVFHLAAQPLVRLSYDTPVETFATNVQGTVHVLTRAAARRICARLSRSLRTRRMRTANGSGPIARVIRWAGMIPIRPARARPNW